MIDTFMKIIDPNFINAELIGPAGAFVVATIKDIDWRESFNQKTNSKEQKQALIFEGDLKPLILNKTNAKKLKELFSPAEDRPENCIGKTVELYVIDTKVGRQTTTGIRIREHAGVKCAECGQEIRPTATRTVDQLVEISKRNTGKVLCISCMQKFAREHKEEENKE